MKPSPIDLWANTNQELVQLLSSTNEFMARQAQRVLHERVAFEELEALKLKGLVVATLKNKTNPQHAARRAMWTLAATGATSKSELGMLLGADDEVARRWAIEFLGSEKQPLAESHHSLVVERARVDSSPLVRRAIASLLQRIPHDQRWDIAAGLTKHRTDDHDRVIPYLVWYGIEPLIDDDPARALSLARQSGWANLTRFTIRRMAESEVGREQVATALAKGAGALDSVLLEELLSSAKSRGGATMPEDWPKAFARLAESKNAQLASMTRAAAVQFGDPSVVPFYQQIVLDRSKSPNARNEAIRTLASLKDAKLPTLLNDLLGDRSVSVEAVRAMAAYDAPMIAKQLISNFAKFDDMTKTAALSTLASRRDSTEQFVAAMESNTIQSGKVPAFIIRQAMTVADEPLLARIEDVWGKIGTTSADKKALYAKYHGILKGRAFEQANKSRGRVLYDKNCGKCHRLFDAGGAIGPNITGANRNSIDYWLENILEPNALIGKDYQTTTFILKDGRVVSGLIAGENDDAVTVQTATDKIVIPMGDIEDRSQSQQSLMPEGQLKPMSDQQVRELIAYLMSPTQVAFPKAQVDPNRPGVTEGEALVAVAKVSDGQVRDQRMTSFGPDWSGDNHLWWTGGRPDSTLDFSVTPETTGKATVILQLTRADDYGVVTISGSGLEAKEVDLYDQSVTLAPLVMWENVAVSKDEPLQFTFKITGKNASARPAYMVGVDYVEVKSAN